MRKSVERRTGEEMVVTVNEAAYAAGVSVKAVNQAIDREQILTHEFRRESDKRKRGARGVAASEIVFLRCHQVLAPEYRKKLYQSLRGKSLSQIPRRFEMNSIVLDLERPIVEIRERLRLLERFVERVESDPEVRGGEPVFRGTRTPVHSVARKIELGASPEEMREDHPHLEEGDFDLATLYAEIYPRRGRPRSDPASDVKRTARP